MSFECQEGNCRERSEEQKQESERANAYAESGLGARAQEELGERDRLQEVELLARRAAREHWQLHDLRAHERARLAEDGQRGPGLQDRHSTSAVARATRLDRMQWNNLSAYEQCL